MLFFVLNRAVSEELLMRSFDLSYNYGLLMIWQNNFITQLSDNSLSPFSLEKMAIGRTTISWIARTL